jgi:sugar-specific transcriptional regulator TrmB
MINELKSLGLSDNEAKVYLAMLELGPAAVLEIASKAEINRPTAYVQIESLKKRGLVSTQTKGKKQLFMAESPEHLEGMLDNQIHQVAVQKEIFAQMLPNLLSVYQSSGSRPTVRFFDGKEGILRVQTLVLKSGASEVLGISSFDDVLQLFPNHLKDYSKKRIQKQIPSRLIYSSSKGPMLSASDPESSRQTKFIPPEKMPFSGDITIFANSVVIVSTKGQVSAVVIEHPGIADSFRGFFNFLWEFASQFPSEK